MDGTLNTQMEAMVATTVATTATDAITTEARTVAATTVVANNNNSGRGRGQKYGNCRKKGNKPNNQTQKMHTNTKKKQRTAHWVKRELRPNGKNGSTTETKRWRKQKSKTKGR